MDPARLTERELAERAGMSVERVRQLVDLGILRPLDGGFARAEVLRARVVTDLEAKGIDAHGLAGALAAGELTLGYLESAGRRHPRSPQTFEQMAAELGMSFETIRRLYVAFGLPVPSPTEHVMQEDAAAIKLVPLLFGAGVEEREVLRLARVWGDGIRRIAQYQSHYFHTTIEEPFRRRGLGDNQAFEAAIREVGLRAGRSGEELLGWLLRRHSETFLVEHQFEHVETALERAGVRRREPRTVEAAAFADLTGYTRLTEEAGDEVAADVSLTLAQLVAEIAARHAGEVVKMLGDGVHFHFRDPGDAVRAALDVVREVRPHGLPPAHIGVNAGPMIYDEGDYFGRTVNIAARIAAQAGADEVFVGEDLAKAVTPDGFRLFEVGPFELKGVAKPVTIYRAVGVDG